MLITLQNSSKTIKRNFKKENAANLFAAFLSPCQLVAKPTPNISY